MSFGISSWSEISISDTRRENVNGQILSNGLQISVEEDFNLGVVVELENDLEIVTVLPKTLGYEP